MYILKLGKDFFFICWIHLQLNSTQSFHCPTSSPKIQCFLNTFTTWLSQKHSNDFVLKLNFVLKLKHRKIKSPLLISNKTKTNKYKLTIKMINKISLIQILLIIKKIKINNSKKNKYPEDLVDCLCLIW